MSTGHLSVGLGLLTASVIVAQGPMYDKVEVNLPYPVTINQTKLQPGDYVIRHMKTPGRQPGAALLQRSRHEAGNHGHGNSSVG